MELLFCFVKHENVLKKNPRQNKTLLFMIQAVQDSLYIGFHIWFYVILLVNKQNLYTNG